jgi:hypothetical protein
VPAAGKAGGGLVKKAAPQAQKTAGDVAGTAAGAVADTTTTAAKGGLPAQSLPSAGLPLGG